MGLKAISARKPLVFTLRSATRIAAERAGRSQTSCEWKKEIEESMLSELADTQGLRPPSNLNYYESGEQGGR